MDLTYMADAISADYLYVMQSADTPSRENYSIELIKVIHSRETVMKLKQFSRAFSLVTLVVFLVQMSHPAHAQSASVTNASASDSLEAANKAIARAFYEDLWFTNHTDRYSEYVADEYVVHDIGDRKGVVEQAIEQKNIADFFHSNGNMTGSIDYQIAEGDLVATRWQWKMEPTSIPFRMMGGSNQIPIINVFRFENGKIVEIWNHRHDIDTGQGNFALLKGLAIGLLIALVGWIWAIVQWRRRRAA
jgi:predicted SnoaL-like aldol condensation-catalyzing enzyme